MVANPPNMGSKIGMNTLLKGFAKIHYQHAKGDFLACFLEPGFNATRISGTALWSEWRAGCFFRAMRNSEQKYSALIPSPTWLTFHMTARETLKNPAHLCENRLVIAWMDWVDGQQAAWLW